MITTNKKTRVDINFNFLFFSIGLSGKLNKKIGGKYEK